MAVAERAFCQSLKHLLMRVLEERQERLGLLLPVHRTAVFDRLQFPLPRVPPADGCGLRRPVLKRFGVFLWPSPVGVSARLVTPSQRPLQLLIVHSLSH